MNKNCYRIIFNKARGQLMVVAEIAKSRTKGVKNNQGSGSPKTFTFGLKPLIFWVWSALGMVGFSATVQAQIVADRNAPGNQQATVLQTASGVTQINIQSPSAAGVSRNTYSQFDIAQQGAILNNSRINVQTQIGGQIQGNPWLAQGSARIILNEVNASNPSQLNGYIEVAGSRAQVVIANPAGITCDGCGFINANRATLTTGTAEFSGGNLTGYQVQGGEVVINGAGLNAMQTDYTDIIAQSVKLNAAIWANKLAITTGTNNVDVNNEQVSAIQSGNGAPAYAIDVAQLGGMYAGKIILIGTEEGVGVRNAGSIASSTGGFVVTASGRIENIGNISASTYVDITSDTDIDNSGIIHAQDNVRLTAAQQIANRHVITSQENILLTASDIKGAESSTLGAGVVADGGVGATGDIVLNATNSIFNHGASISGASQAFTAQTIDVSKSRITAENLTLSAIVSNGSNPYNLDGNVIADDTNIVIESQLDINVSNTLQTNRAFLSAKNLYIRANDLINIEGILVQEGTENFDITLQGDFNNTQGRIVVSGQDFSLTANNIQNTEGRIEHLGAGNTVLQAANNIESTRGFIDGAENLTMTATEIFYQAGQIAATDTLMLNAQAIDLSQSQLSALNLMLTARIEEFPHSDESLETLLDENTREAGNIVVDEANLLVEQNLAFIASNTLQTNRAFVTAETLAIQANDLTNVAGVLVQTGVENFEINLQGDFNNAQGRLVTSSQNLTLMANNIQNIQGRIEHLGTGSSILSANYVIENTQGLIEVKEDLDMTATSILNQEGFISAKGSLSLENNLLNNQNGTVQSQEALKVIASEINNIQGRLSATQTLVLKSSQEINNRNGTLSAGTAMSLQSRLFRNQGGVAQAQGELAISASIINNAQGRLTSAQNLTLNSKQTLNNSGGLISSGTDLFVQSSAFNNENGTVQSQGTLTVNASDINNAQGKLIASQNLILNSEQALNNRTGLISSGTDLSVKSGAFNNENGTVQSQGTLTVNASDINNTQGGFTATQALKLTIDNTLNNRNGLISSREKIILQSGALNNQGGSVQSQGTLSVNATSINNVQGRLGSAQGLNLRTGALNNQFGSVQSQGSLVVAAASINNAQGKLSSTQDLTLNSGALNNQGGSVQAQGALNVTATDINNAQGSLSSAQALNVESDAFNNESGSIQSQGTLTVNASEIDNAQGRISAGQTLTLNSDTTVNNSNGSIFSEETVLLQGGALNNENGTVQAQGGITVNAEGDINNVEGRFISVQSLKLNNSGFEFNNEGGLIQSQGRMTLSTTDINNEQGSLISAQALTLNSQELVGEGAISTQGAAFINVQNSFVNTGSIQANGIITINTNEAFVNESIMESLNRIDIIAATLENKADAQITSTNITLKTTEEIATSFMNYGIINGQQVTIDTEVLNNIGTGQIYGDKIALNAVVINNLQEGENSAVIAANNQVNIGTMLLNNTGDGLIYSGGNLLIGGALDSNYNVIGKADIVNNGGTLEAVGQVDIRASSEINNINENLVTELQQVSREDIVEYQGQGGQRYLAGTEGVTPIKRETWRLKTPEKSYTTWYKYDYERIISETVVVKSDPGKIISGGDMVLDSAKILNEDSWIIAGGETLTLVQGEDSLENRETNAIRTTSEQGTTTNVWRKKGDRAWGKKDKTKTRNSAYSPADTVENIALGASKVQIGQAITSSNVNIASLNLSEVAQSTHTTDQNTDQSRPQLFEILVTNDLTGEQEAIQTISVNTQLPSSSLFQINTDASTSTLITTAPQLSSSHNALGSDYLLNQLASSTTQNTIPIAPQRLGDGFYEQRLIQEQIAQLTGQRFLTGFTDNQAQYQALMDNALAYLQAHNLQVGDALNAEQMSQITQNMVWMVEKNITQADGTQQTVLVPQLYVKRSTDESTLQTGASALISANNIVIDIVGDVINSGRIQSNQITQISANNLQNTGGQITGEDIRLQAQTDLNNQGGQIIASNSLQAIAGRDLVIESTTNTQTSAQGERTNLASLAEMRIIGGTGDLYLQAGQDLIINGANLQNEATGQTNLIAGQNIILGTVNTAQSQEIIFDRKNWLKESQASQIGTTIQSNGNILMQAGQNITATATIARSEEGDISLNAINGNLTLSAGQNSQQSSYASEHKNGEMITSTEQSNGTASQTQLQMSRFSGNNVTLQAGESIDLSATELSAQDLLSLSAKAINISALNAENIRNNTESESDLLTVQSANDIQLNSQLIGSSLNGKDILLNATEESITLTGSTLNAQNALEMYSAKDITIQAGYQDSLTESSTQSSGWFTGGSVFASKEELKGRTIQAGVQSSLNATNITLNAGNNLLLNGVTMQAKEDILGLAQNIIITNTQTQQKDYSKSSSLKVSLGDVVQSLARPDEAITSEEGKVSMTLAKAEYESLDQRRTTNTNTQNEISANNIQFTARTDKADKVLGNILIEGANLTAKNNLLLNATHNVTVKEARNSQTDKEKIIKGKAELKVVVKNEYVLIKGALEAVQAATEQLADSKDSYDDYQKNLKIQQNQLNALKQDLKNEKIGIEQVDIDEMQELISDLKSDEDFYKASIVLATANLATKTTALIAQGAKAAASTFYGFNAGIELDIEALEKQFNATQGTAVASNLSANNIQITSGEKTTLQGSNLNANNAIQINAKELDILASIDQINSENSSEKKNITLSFDLIGGASASASNNSRIGTNSTITQNNSILTAQNIQINTENTTRIEGATIQASDTLTLNTKDLIVASVQDRFKSKDQSQGQSVGFGSSGLSSVGFNNATGRTNNKQTVLTSLTGEIVNINVQNSTQLTGALIAAVDQDGNDNQQLNFKTNTLEVSSLSNRQQSKNQSMGLDISLKSDNQPNAETNPNISSAGIDYSKQNNNQKTKTLGTIGQGNLQIADTDNSNTKMLNRDIQNLELNIYDIESSQTLQGSLDMDLLSESGRNNIANNLEINKVGFYDTASDILNTESLTALDAFTHQGNKVALHQGIQQALQGENNPMRDALADPNLSQAQQTQLLTQLANQVAQELNIPLGDINVINSQATSENGNPILGAYHPDSGDITLIDNQITNTEQSLNVLGHEIAHALDDSQQIERQGITEQGQSYSDEYADTIGQSLSNAVEFAMWNYGGGENLANSNLQNNPTTEQSPQAVQASELFEQRNQNGELEYKQEHISRDLNMGLSAINIPDHRANIVIRNKIEDYPQDIRNRLGDPIYVQNKGYVYVLEDISVMDEKGVLRLYPSINDSLPNGAVSPTLENYQTGSGNLQTYAELPDDFVKEDALIRGYIDDIEKGVINAPVYPELSETLLCTANNCSDSFYNSNTSADTRLENVGISVPDTDLSSVPGGFYDREGASNDRAGSAVDAAGQAIVNTFDKVTDFADSVTQKITSWK